MNPGTQITPGQVMEQAFAFARTHIVRSAVELELFTHIGRGRHTVAELVKATGASERGIRILLNALVGIGMLQKAHDRYALTDVSRAFLVKDSPGYIGGFLMFTPQVEKAYEDLTTVVRTGRPPVDDIHGTSEQGEFFSHFVDSLYNLNQPGAEAAARAVFKEQGHGLHVLDIGAGSGVWGLAFARFDPQTRVTFADWPKVLDRVTRPFVAQHRVENQVEYLEGDFHNVDFGEEKYDVATIGHICHGEGVDGTRKLFARVKRALKPGGSVVIGEFVADEERAHNTLALIFAVNMLVHTETGDSFTFSELRQWLEEAGFEGTSQLQAPAISPLIVARRRSAAVEKIAA